MVREVLADPDLDPTVRALSIERLEASLLERAQARLGADRDLSVRLEDDGVVTVFEGAAPLDDGALTAHLDLTLVAKLAPTIGAARVDVKRGVRPSKPRPSRVTEPPAELALAPVAWTEIAQRLAALVRLQEARIAELEAALGVTASRREFEVELRAIEAALRATRDG